MKTADLGNMNKAAEALPMMQPNLGRAIIDLETESNIKLFKRNNKDMVMTEGGKKLYQYSRTILNQMDLIRGMALEEIVPVFSIAFHPLISTSRLLCEVRNNHKGGGLRIQLPECRLQCVTEIVESGEVELGFLVYNDVQSEEIKYMLRYKHVELSYLGVDTWYANMGPCSPLYSREEVEALELFSHPIVRMPGDYFSNLTFYLSIDGISLTEFKKVEYMSDNAAMINLLKYTDVFRFRPGISGEDFTVHEIKTIPIENCEANIGIAWIRREKEILSAATQEFV